jgi:ATP-dependent RNA helicase DeaD
MVFCNTQHTTDFIAKNLIKQGIDSLAIHGGFSQAKRDAAMDKFQKAKVAVLVCTDVAARGLDIGDVSHVYNYDIPKDPKSYVHRIGRTARAGKEGIAINILGSRDHENFSAVLRNNDVEIERVDVPQFEKLRFDHGHDHSGDRHMHGRGREGGRGNGGGRFGGRGRSNGGGNRDRDSGRDSSGSGERSSGDRPRFKKRFGNGGGNRSGGFRRN